MKANKSRVFLALIIMVALVAGGILPATAQEPEQARRASDTGPGFQTVLGPDRAEKFKAGEVLVKFRPGVSAASVENALSRSGAERIRMLYGSDVELWRVPEGSELATVDQLMADAAVEYAEPNYVYFAFDTLPNDPRFSKQWGHLRVNSPAGWDVTTGSAGTTIAVIDTGVDPGHPDLAAKLVAGYDFVGGDTTPRDLNGHGTHVAGIAAAVTNNGTGVAGMDWQAKIMPVRVLDAAGSGYSSDITDGIVWARQHGAEILNLSLGGNSYSQAMQDAVTAAHNAGRLVVAAMGNCRTGCTIGGTYYVNPTMYPAAYSNVMAVAATGPTDLYSSFSQYGSHCDIAAPGGDMSYYQDPDGIMSTMPTYPVYLTTNYGYLTNYDYLNGTSQATPFVAGLAGLVWAADPALSPDGVQTLIEDTAKDLGTAGWDATYGHGLIDVEAALALGAPPDAPVLYAISNTDGDGSFTVDWSDVPNATGYTLQEDDNAAFSSPTNRYSGPNSQFAVTGRGPGTWYYRVRAFNDAGDSPWSNVQSVTVRPNPPTLNAISNASNEDEYVVSWSAADTATSYTLQEDNNASFSSPEIRYVGTALQYNVTGQAGGTWYYRVRATNAGGNSLWSNTRSTTVDPPALDAPVLSAINNTDGDGDYLVDWSEVTGSTQYTLEQSIDPYFAVPTVAYSGAASQYSVTNQPSGTWYYRVRAAGPGGRGPWSNEESAVVPTLVYLPIMLRDFSVGGTGDFGLPISEGFEGGVVPPSGWTRVRTNPRQTWSIMQSSSVYQGLYSADCEYDDQLGIQDEVLLSPQFQSSSAQLRFQSFGSTYWCRDNFDNCDLNIWLVVGTWGGGDDIFVRTADSDWAGVFVWSPSNINLTPYLPAGTPVRVGFQYEGQDGAQIALDAISITE